MKPIYHNMDKLEITFQGAFPEKIIDLLKETQEEAQQIKKFIPIALGVSKETYKILSTGLGGYSLGFITSDDGIQISTQKSNDKKLWNIFVGVRSWYLASNGYEASKERILDILQDLGAETNERLCPYTGEYTTIPLESIRRLDYCFDFILPDFVPSEKNIIYHQSGKIKENGVFSIDRQGTKKNALTIGTRKNRQLQIYDKILEINNKGNQYWYKIWGLKPQDRKDVWRVECRFFKNYIRNNNLRTFYDVERNFSKELDKSFNAIRYVVPNNDSNKSRWPNIDFWDSAKLSASEALKYNGCDDVSEMVHDLRRSRSLEAIEKMFLGLYISLAVLKEIPYADILKAPKLAEEDIRRLLKHNPEMLEKKYNDTYNRYFTDQF